MEKQKEVMFMWGSLAGILFTLLVSFGLPILLGLFWRKKYRISALPIILGALFYIIFALVLENLLHNLVFNILAANPSFSKIISHPVFYVIYGCLAAGLFEEISRFIGLSIVKGTEGEANVGTGFSYGLGHGGAEMAIIVGVSSIQNIIFWVMINISKSDTVAIPREMYSYFNTSEGIQFAVGGIERIIALSLHIALSVLVWMVVKKQVPKRYLLVSILLHALTNVGATLYQIKIITNIWLVELYTGVVVVGVIIFVVCLYQKTKNKRKLTF